MSLKWQRATVDVDDLTDDYLDGGDAAILVVVPAIVNMPVTRLTILNRGDEDVIGRWIEAGAVAADIDVADEALDDDDPQKPDTFIVPAGLPFSVDLTDPNSWETRGLALRFLADPTTGSFIEINYTRATRAETHV